MLAMYNKHGAAMLKIDENGVKPTSGQAEATLKNFTRPRQCLKSRDRAQRGQ